MSDDERFPSRSLPLQGRLAGIDFGDRRIGIAICDPGRMLASPYESYERRNERLDSARFRQLVAEEELVGFVIGLPVHATGEESDKSREVRRFAEWLRAVTGLPLVFYDERYTSKQADALMRGSRLSHAQKKKRRDKLAAQIILSAYLASPAAALEPPPPLDDRELPPDAD
jgi:putative holliday junction resolvase